MKRLFGKGKTLTAALLAVCLMFMGIFSGCVTAQEMEDAAPEFRLGLKLTGSVEGENAGMINRYLENSGIELNIGTKGDKALAGLAAVVAKQDLFSLLLEFGGGKVAFSFPGTDGNRYEFEPLKLAESLKLQELLGELLSSSGLQALDPAKLSGPDITPEEYEKALTPYIQIIAGHVVTKIRSEDTVIELKNLEEELEGTVYTYEPDAEEIISLLNDLADQLEKDETLKEMIGKWADYIRSMQGILTITGAGSSDMDAEEAADALEQGFAQLSLNMREFAQTIEESGMEDVVIRFQSSVADRQTVKFTAFAGDEYESYEAGFEFLPAENGVRLCGYITQGDVEYPETWRLICSGSSNNAQVNGNLVLENITADTKMTAASVDTHWDLSEASEIGIPYGSFTLGSPAGNLNIQVGGSADGGSDHTIRIYGFGDLTGSDDITGFSLKLHSTKEARLEEPSGEVVDISGLSREEAISFISSLGQKIASKFQMMPEPEV